MPETAFPINKIRRRSRWWLWIAFVLTGLALLGACNLHVAAFREILSIGDPPSIDPWFIEHIAILPNSLPDGVTMQVVSKSGLIRPAEYLEIANSSPTPLYLAILKPPATGLTGPVFAPAPIELPIQGLPAFRIVSGELFLWSSTSPTTPWQTGWQTTSNTLRLAIWQQYLSLDSDRPFDYLFVEIEARNKFDSSRDRPSNVQIPAPQATELSMVYGADPIHVSLMISYELNSKYPPPLHVDALRQQANSLLLLVTGAWVIGAVIGIIRLFWNKGADRQQSA